MFVYLYSLTFLTPHLMHGVTIRLLCGTDNISVGIVDGGSVQSLEINLRRMFRGVSHGIADDANGQIHSTCNTRPRVAGDIHGER